MTSVPVGSPLSSAPNAAGAGSSVRDSALPTISSPNIIERIERREEGLPSGSDSACGAAGTTADGSVDAGSVSDTSSVMALDAAAEINGSDGASSSASSRLDGALAAAASALLAAVPPKG